MFTVDPSEIESLDGKQLVELLRVLLYAEARKADVPLRNVDVPLQITVADDGQDASILWRGGLSETNYLPGRDVVFQCKARDRGDAKWTAEVWTKKTQPKKIKAKALNPAVQGVVARGGCYVGITASSLVGTKAADRAEAIRTGIRDAGADPNQLHAVEVYDANKLAAWASDHPAVALWIKERDAQMSLASFATLDRWGRRAEIATPPFVPSSAREFALGAAAADILTFDQLAGRIVDHVGQPGACIRLWGASGIGKTRALHEALRGSLGSLRNEIAAGFIFCDFRDVTIRIRDVANQIRNDDAAAVLVVDNCPVEEAAQLNDLARAEGSQLRIITIGADGCEGLGECLAIRPMPSDKATITGILAKGLKTNNADELNYVAELCGGFPRIAVLVAASYAGRQSVLRSADDVAEQILRATKLKEDTERAIEGLALFEQLAPDIVPDSFDRAAELLVDMSGNRMFEHLVIASDQHLVGRNREQMSAQPRPIADYLALRRLRYLRASTLIGFLDGATPAQRDAMLARWPDLARAPVLIEVVQHFVHTRFAATEALLAEAAPYLIAFTHVAPDITGHALSYAITQTSLDDLARIPITDGLVGALRLLASRASSFNPATLMVMRLAAAEDALGQGAGDPDGSALLELMRQLFQVGLAGTAADDRRRRDTMAEAIGDGDARMRRVCIDALGAMLRTRISRNTTFEQIGAEAFQFEWQPEDEKRVFDYFAWALGELLVLWRASPEDCPAIEKHVAADMRNLLEPEILPSIERFVDAVVAARGEWFEATQRIGDWLYYDRPEPTDDFARAVRALYDKTLPSDPVDLAILHSRFWATDIHDPDTRYSPDDTDYDYSIRRVQALAPAIAADPAQLDRIIAVMTCEEMHTPYPVAAALADHLLDPIATFRAAVASLDLSGSRAGIGFVRALLAALDTKFADDPALTAELVATAEVSVVLSADPMDIHTALRVTEARAAGITAQIRDGRIAPRRVIPLSYGRALDALPHAALTSLIEALVLRDEEGGAWAAVEILSMVTHGRATLPADMADLIKLVLTAPAIARGVEGSANMADHSFGQLIGKLSASKAIDDAFARGFAQQIVEACRSGRTSPHRPSDALRSALATVMKAAPREIWPVLAGFYEVATRIERDRLKAILAVERPFARANAPTVPGPLFATKLETMIDWVDDDAEGRVAFLIGFFPLLVARGDDYAWHPALQALAVRYGKEGTFRAALRSRIFPNSWSGSLEEHLTAFRTPLNTWTTLPHLGDWAITTIEAIESRLNDDFFRL